MRTPSLVFIFAALFLVGVIGRPAWSDQAEKIRDSGVLRIATNPGIEPMEYRRNGELSGFDIAVGNALAEHMGVRAEWVVYENLDDLVKLIKNGKSKDEYDIVLSAMGIDDERTQHSIAVPYFKSGLTILASASENVIEELDDLFGLEVAAVAGSTEHGIVSRMADVVIVTAANYGECVDYLVMGKAQAAVLDVPVALLAEKRNPDKLRASKSAFEIEWYGIYMNKDEKHLFRETRDAVKMMQRDGTFERLYAIWF